MQSVGVSADSTMRQRIKRVKANRQPRLQFCCARPALPAPEPVRMRAMRVLMLLLAMGVPALAQGIAWRTDYEAARTRAKLEGKLIFLDFYSPG